MNYPWACQPTPFKDETDNGYRLSSTFGHQPFKPHVISRKVSHETPGITIRASLAQGLDCTQFDATTLVLQGQTATVDDSANLIVIESA